MKKITMFFFSVFLAFMLCACAAQGISADKNKMGELVWEGSMSLSYASQFSVDYYKEGYRLITITDGGKFLVIPKDKEVPKNLAGDITVLKQPLKNIYLVSTSAMDLFRAAEGMESIRLSGTREEDWFIEEAKAAMKQGDILYAGKYNAPDYELILAENCGLAVENTMIYHSPQVKEKLESLGIPVLTERSSYESHPLGRVEWIKLYGILLGKEELAEKYFDGQVQKLEEVFGKDNSGRRVAFFSVTSNGAVCVRKSGDYVSKMIELAGGNYIFSDMTEENALSTMNIQMEEFYAAAKDADILIYNSTITGELTTLEELLEKNELLKDFKAVKEGKVWCTSKNMFQETTGIGDMIADFHQIITEETDRSLVYLYPLK